MKKVTVSKFEKVGEKEFQRVVFFFKEKKIIFLNIIKSKIYKSLKTMYKKILVGSATANIVVFKQIQKLNCLMCCFIKYFLKIFEKKKENFLIFKQLFEKYK